MIYTNNAECEIIFLRSSLFNRTGRIIFPAIENIQSVTPKRNDKIKYFYNMFIEISQKKMSKLGELVFAAFDHARKSSGLGVKDLLSEGILPYRQKLYAV